MYTTQATANAARPAQETGQTLKESSGREEDEISLDQVRWAIKKLKNRKATRHECISPEMVKYVSTGEEYGEKF